MKTKEKSTNVVVGVLALAGLFWFFSLATAGDLEPNAPPAPTMKTLDEIYDAAIAGSSGISEREGYMQHCEVDPCSSETFFTVPAGKQFVLMKLWFRDSTDKMYLTVNDNLFIGDQYFCKTAGGGTHVDFPDRCITVDAGETLKAVNDHWSSLQATIVGYFYDVP